VGYRLNKDIFGILFGLGGLEGSREKKNIFEGVKAHNVIIEICK